MFNKNSLICVILCLFCFSAGAQEWIELNESEKLEFIDMSRSTSNSTGCHRLEYAFYNFTLKSTPTERLTGFQCIRGDTTISNVLGKTFGYADPNIAIEVDSNSESISIGYNNLYGEIKQLQSAGVEALIANAVMVEKMNSNKPEGRETYRIKSGGQNGIEFYEAVYIGEKLTEFQINYRKVYSPRFREEPEVSKPIVTIKFTPVEKCYLETMMSPRFFLRTDKNETTPAARFRDFELNDFRVTTSPH